MYQAYCSLISDDNKFLSARTEIYTWARFFENILLFTVMKLSTVHGHDLVSQHKTLAGSQACSRNFLYLVWLPSPFEDHFLLEQPVYVITMGSLNIFTWIKGKSEEGCFTLYIRHFWGIVCILENENFPL